MADIVTAAEIKAAFQIENTNLDTAITLHMATAQALVLDHVNDPDGTWTDSTAPANVKAAVILAVGNLLFRPETDPFSEAVRSCLVPHHDPTLA